MAIGAAALTFAARSIARVRVEKHLIQAMWNQKTTVKMLREMAERGEQLPKTVLLRGKIGADSLYHNGVPVVQPLTPRIPGIAGLIGNLKPPANYFEAILQLSSYW